MAIDFHQLFPEVVIDGITYKNLFNKYQVNRRYIQDVTYYYEYIVQDTDRPDILAYQLFGNAKWWWLVLLFNDIDDPYFGFPMSENELKDTLALVIAENPTADPADIEASIRAENEEKRNIKIPRAEFVYEIISSIKRDLGITI